MMRTRLGTAWICGAFAVAVGIACGDGEGADSNGAPGLDASFEANVTGLDAASPEDGASAGDGQAADAGPRDPFVAQWKATRDVPVAADYVVDKTNGIVTDKATGLVWSRAALTEANLPPDGGDGNGETQAQARAQCASATIGGTAGWRLPTRMELLTVLTLDEQYAHEPSSFTSNGYDNVPIWAATDATERNAYYEGHYHVHTFHANLVGAWASATTQCVKSPYPVTANAQPPDPNRFKLTGKVLADEVTKLEWFTTVNNTSLMWTQASDYCATLSTGDAGAPAGPNPWRLPTLKEAASLWNESTKGLHAAFGTLGTTFYFWTSFHFVPPSYLIMSSGYFRIYFDSQNPSGDFFWDVADFAPAICVRNATGS